MKFHCFSLFVVFLISGFPQIDAATLVLTGTIEQVDASSYANVSVGNSFHLQIDYDPNVSDDDPSATLGRYLIPSQSIVLTVSGVGKVFESTGGSINTLFGGGISPNEIVILGSEAGFHFLLAFQDDEQPTIVDDSFPDPFPNLSEFDFASFGIITNGPTTGIGPSLPELSGSVSTLVIPEPHGIVFLGLGLVIFGARRRL